MACLLILVCFALCAGCAGGPSTAADATGAEASNHPTQAVALYESVLAVYADRDLDVEVASAQMLLVGSPFVEIEAGIRRRIITRVLPFGGNVALNVVVEYQEKSEDVEDVEELWETVTEESAWAKKAAAEELELGRAIERHFHRHQRHRR